MATIEMKSLFARAPRTEWETGYPRIIDMPERAWTSREEAEEGLPADEVVVPWDELVSRVLKDIHEDS